MTKPSTLPSKTKKRIVDWYPIFHRLNVDSDNAQEIIMRVETQIENIMKEMIEVLETEEWAYEQSKVPPPAKFRRIMKQLRKR